MENTRFFLYPFFFFSFFFFFPHAVRWEQGCFAAPAVDVRLFRRAAEGDVGLGHVVAETFAEVLAMLLS